MRKHYRRSFSFLGLAAGAVLLLTHLSAFSSGSLRAQPSGPKELKVKTALVHDPGLQAGSDKIVFLVLIDRDADCASVREKKLPAEATYITVDLKPPITPGTLTNPKLNARVPGAGMAFFFGPTGTLTIKTVTDRLVTGTADIQHQLVFVKGPFSATVCK